MRLMALRGTQVVAYLLRVVVVDMGHITRVAKSHIEIASVVRDPRSLGAA